MEKLDRDAKTSLCNTIATIREDLFRLADSSRGLDGCADCHDFLQRANFQLGRAEDELSGTRRSLARVDDMPAPTPDPAVRSPPQGRVWPALTLLSL